MHPRWWWLRLLFFQWFNAWRAAPVRRTLLSLSWLVPVIAFPVGFSLAGAQQAAAAMEWVLSFDMPLELLLAAQVGMAIVALGSRADTESWISPATGRGMAGRALFAVRLLGAVRWPLGVAFAALLLSFGNPHAAAHLGEILLIDGFGLIGGASLAWLLLGQRQQAAAAAAYRQPPRGHGFSALSWVPLRETQRLLRPRRLALLAVPILLAAPMGSAAQVVLRALMGWTVLVYIANWWREVAHTARAMQKWMPDASLRAHRLHWYIWRHVLLATALGAATLWLGSRVTAAKPVIIKP